MFKNFDDEETYFNGWNSSDAQAMASYGIARGKRTKLFGFEMVNAPRTTVARDIVARAAIGIRTVPRQHQWHRFEVVI